jgi:hypothetical protein
MLRDNLAGLIEPMFDSAGAHALALAQDPKRGMLQINLVGNRRSEAILERNFSVENRRQGKIAGLAVNAEVHGSRAVRTAPHKSHRTIDPQCLANPRPEGAESTLTENAASPFSAEPRHHRVDRRAPYRKDVDSERAPASEVDGVIERHLSAVADSGSSVWDSQAERQRGE